MRRADFEQLVAAALDDLPPPFLAYLDNIVVVVEPQPSSELRRAMGLEPYQTLLGLYQGIPLTQRGIAYGNVLPDHITIFQQPIEAIYHTPEAVKAAVQDTVIHEIGHFFGLDDAQIDALMQEGA